MDSVMARPSGMFVSLTIPVQTQHARQFIDITQKIMAETAASGIANGLVVVSSQHTTAAIVVNEHEPELHKDLDRLLAGLAPEEAEYAHNAVPCLQGERENGHAHCQALLLPSSVSLPLIAGELALGRYQRVFLVELDHARPRRVVITILGS